MTQEEKAKAYDDAIKYAHYLINERCKEGTNGSFHRVDLQKMFPELKESEDERIRKWIIENIKETIDVNGFFKNQKTMAKKALSWLEKQGEKLAEPNWCHHKVDLSDCSEEYRKAYYDGWNNCNMQHSQYNVEKNDVIKCLINGMRFYYEGNKDATWGTDKWSMPVKHIIDVLEKQGEQKPILDVEIPFGAKDSELEEASYNIPNGYHAEIEDNKVVIKKGEQKSADKVEPKFKVGDTIYFNSFGKIKSMVVYTIIDNGDGNPMYEDVYGYSVLEKDIIEHKSAWSEEDEETLKDIITSMTNLKDSATSDALKDIYNSKINWLKSLKERYTWKPSEEQIKVLNEVINFAADHGTMRWNDYIYNVLKGLREQLKKL